jgi:alpha-D-xyloside xylohydrolase
MIVTNPSQEIDGAAAAARGGRQALSPCALAWGLIARRGTREPRAVGLFLRHACLALVLAAAVALQTHWANAEESKIVLDRDGSTIVLEPYAANIIRVSLSQLKDQATAAPGYGFIATPSAQGWTRQKSDQGEIYRSSRLVVKVTYDFPRMIVQNDPEVEKYFGGFRGGPGHITISTPEGKVLLELKGWSMFAASDRPGTACILNERRPSDAPFYRVNATFVSPEDEHYYGAGQHQQGYLDLRGHKVECWHDYFATGGESLGVPFVVTNRGYGMIWDNPSKTTFEPGFNEQTRWTSEVGDRVSFFVIAGATTDEIYSGYRQLTGTTPMLPKAAYGFIQCKERYMTQDELMGVAKGYRQRHLPVDMIVVDFLHYTKMGEMDMNPETWPDPIAMNRQLHDMGFETMISVWPRFAPGSRFYDFLVQKGWLMHLADGTPTNGLPFDRTGSDIDTTNPEAARWFWDVIRDNEISKGFDAIWADETEPDLPPNGSYFHIGPGTRYFNVYPLFHTAAIYDGFRRDVNHRALVLARAAYLGAQRNGTIFWSSDIYATWDQLKRQVPAGLGFTASGLPYWSNDIGGFLYLPAEHHPAHPPLLDPCDARENVQGNDDYPELYTRWFEYGAFLPIFRTHGSRLYNEVWTYGKQAEPILIKYLRLRYQLLPYIYPLGYNTYRTGAPYMRALFMDFPNDPQVADLRDEYMFGPAFLVAPVTEQGATSRMVYLPAGADWYNYWSNERFHGGQTIKVDAPIDTLPLFVRAGSIVPLGEPIENTQQVQKIAKVRVYAGANGDFTLYQDDGKTYAYEKGECRITRLHWDDVAHKLSHEGAAAWTVPDEQILEVIEH